MGTDGQAEKNDVEVPGKVSVTKSDNETVLVGAGAGHRDHIL